VLLIFLQAAFIAVVILHQTNIWVTFISNPTATFLIVGLSILLLTLTTSKLSLRIPPRQTLLAFSIASLSQVALSIGVGGLGGGGNRLTSIVGYALLTALCLIIISRWRQGQERYAIKVYIIASSIMALLGFAAWLMVSLDWVFQQQIDPTYFIDIEQFTHGKANRIAEVVERANQFGIYENTYSFPYSLGLVLTNSYLYEFAGIQFFRASGWYTEPVAIWFMIIPAIVLTCYKSYFNKTTRTILLVTQCLFLFASFSLSIIAGLITIYVFRRLLSLFVYGVSLKSIAFVVMAAGVFGLLGVYAFGYVPESSLALNILFSKVSAGDYGSIVLETLIDPVFGLAYLYFFVVALACSWRAAKENNNALMSFSLVVLCFLIVALKGAFLHLLISPGFFIFFALMLKHLRSNPDMRRVRTPVGPTANNRDFHNNAKTPDMA